MKRFQEGTYKVERANVEQVDKEDMYVVVFLVEGEEFYALEPKSKGLITDNLYVCADVDYYETLSELCEHEECNQVRL